MFTVIEKKYTGFSRKVSISSDRKCFFFKKKLKFCFQRPSRSLKAKFQKCFYTRFIWRTTSVCSRCGRWKCNLLTPSLPQIISVRYTCVLKPFKRLLTSLAGMQRGTESSCVETSPWISACALGSAVASVHRASVWRDLWRVICTRRATFVFLGPSQISGTQRRVLRGSRWSFFPYNVVSVTKLHDVDLSA